jgi:hypothetical protein
MYMYIYIYTFRCNFHISKHHHHHHHRDNKHSIIHHLLRGRVEISPGGVGVMMLKLLLELEEIQVRGIRLKDNKLSPLRRRIEAKKLSHRHRPTNPRVKVLSFFLFSEAFFNLLLCVSFIVLFVLFRTYAFSGWSIFYIWRIVFWFLLCNSISINIIIIIIEPQHRLPQLRQGIGKTLSRSLKLNPNLNTLLVAIKGLRRDIDRTLNPNNNRCVFSLIMPHILLICILRVEIRFCSTSCCNLIK